MAEHFSITYSTADTKALALRPADELAAGPPPIAQAPVGAPATQAILRHAALRAIEERSTA